MNVLMRQFSLTLHICCIGFMSLLNKISELYSEQLSVLHFYAGPSSIADASWVRGLGIIVFVF